MFPAQLSFYLDAEIVQCTNEVIHEIFPNLKWGLEADLLKHSDDWPDAVALIKHLEPFGGAPPCDYSVEINFVHFPGRVAGNDSEMQSLKLALLRKLAAIFECTVLCSGREYCRPENGRLEYTYMETLLCRGGRIFSGHLSLCDVREGARPHQGWIPLDDIPKVSISSKGLTISNPSAVTNWIATRDQTHLENCESPIYPLRETEEDSAGAEEEAVEPEFLSGEELEWEEWEAGEHFKRLDAWERGYETTSSKQLIQSGISLPPPDSFTSEATLHKKLWEVIRGMRKCNTYLSSTDHLSDLELYTYLWNKGLNEGIMDLTGLTGCGMHLDLLGSGDEESKNISVIYYDSPEDRAEWRASFPGDKIPAHIEKPFDRDRHLPKRDY